MGAKAHPGSGCQCCSWLRNRSSCCWAEPGGCSGTLGEYLSSCPQPASSRPTQLCVPWAGSGEGLGCLVVPGGQCHWQQLATLTAKQETTTLLAAGGAERGGRQGCH